jgi:hypothetical protein
MIVLSDCSAWIAVKENVTCRPGIHQLYGARVTLERFPL